MMSMHPLLSDDDYYEGFFKYVDSSCCVPLGMSRSRLPVSFIVIFDVAVEFLCKCSCTLN